jgi:predicted nucleotidyltransferase
VLYGSRARGDYKSGSDIDLALHGDDTLTHTILSRIANDLDDQLLPYTIDLSIFENIRNPEMVEQIERIGVPLYKK